MGVEESVYLAKLAEQAERYEGEHTPVQKLLLMLIPVQKWLRT